MHSSNNYYALTAPRYSHVGERNTYAETKTLDPKTHKNSPLKRDTIWWSTSSVYPSKRSKETWKYSHFIETHRKELGIKQSFVHSCTWPKTYNNMDTHITELNQLLTYTIHKHITGLNQLIKWWSFLIMTAVNVASYMINTLNQMSYRHDILLFRWNILSIPHLQYLNMRIIWNGE